MEATRCQKQPSEAKNGMKESTYWKKFLWKLLSNLKTPLIGPIRFEPRPQGRKIQRPPRSLYKTMCVADVGNKIWEYLLRAIGTNGGGGAYPPVLANHSLEEKAEGLWILVIYNNMLVSIWNWSTE